MVLLVSIGVDEGDFGGWGGSKDYRLKAIFVDDFCGRRHGDMV